MALPELDVARVLRWCAARVPEHALHQVRVECESPHDTSPLSSGAPPWREDFGPEWTSFPIARLRYTAADKSWILYWRDRIFASTAPSYWIPRTKSKSSSPRSTATRFASSGDNPGPTPDSTCYTQVGPTTSVTVGPV